MSVQIPPAHDAARLVRGEPVVERPDAIEETLLTAARIVLLELEALRASSVGDAVRIAEEVHRAATSGGAATIGAIGVTCVLAGQLRRPDERVLAATLHRARAVFTDRELLDGASALCGAACARLALTFGLPRAEVAAIVDAVARRHVSGCGGGRLQRRPIGDRCRRPGRRQSAAS